MQRHAQPELDITAPDAARPFVVAALADHDRSPLLVVSANGREADDLTAELAELLGDPRAVVQFPSWETLPHERLSPSADTVGRRLAVLHRLAHPEGDPLRVVVTTVRSLVQPMAPGLGEARSIDLAEGIEIDFDGLLAQLVEMAYERVDMVGGRGEFAVRGGILDVFPTTADYPVRVEFWGDEISEIRAFSVADQRSQPEIDASTVRIHPCRELVLSTQVRARAAELAGEAGDDQMLSEMLTKLSEGIPVAGMEALIPALVDGEMQLLTQVVPDGTRVLILDPEKVRTRAAGLAESHQETEGHSAPHGAREGDAAGGSAGAGRGDGRHGSRPPCEAPTSRSNRRCTQITKIYPCTVSTVDLSCSLSGPA